jgi:uncharacterized protein (TIGR03084 family)
MRAILADLVAEQQALDQLLQRAPDRDWKRRTANTGWTVQDTISHLAWSEDNALLALEGNGEATPAFSVCDDGASRNDPGVAAGRGKRPQEIIEWWRHARAAVVDALSRCRPDVRIGWPTPETNGEAFAAVRLTETWAHSLDITAALSRDVEDTPRIRHVAWLAWLTLPLAFAHAEEAYSGPIRLELVGPGYARWVYGPDDSDQIVRGAAGDWCRVAVHRLRPEDSTSLTATGEIAETALRVACALP